MSPHPSFYKHCLICEVKLQPANYKGDWKGICRVCRVLWNKEW